MSDFSILKPDGTNFKPSDTEVKYISTNESLDKFLTGGVDSSINIITGQKGSGKSILISYKSYLDRIAKDNTYFIPEEGTEKISLSDELSAKDLAKHVRYQEWNKIFNVSIYYFILSRLHNQLIDYDIINKVKYNKIQFHDLFNPLDLDPTKIKFGSILYKCINNRSIIYEQNSNFIDIVKHILSVYIAKRNVKVYLDNLDQALFSALINENPYHSNNANNYSLNKKTVDLKVFLESESSFHAADRTVLCWLNCHIGFLLSLYEINSLDRRLNVYSTFRLEAYQYYNYLRLKNGPQIRSRVMKIEYSDKDFKKIYDNLLKAAAIDEAALCLNSLDKLPHLYVKNKIRDNETIWNFIKRHTFFNPREITFQVNVIKEIVRLELQNSKNKSEIQNKFKESISEEALSQILKDLQTETLPFFPEDELLDFYQRNKKNYIKHDDLLEKDKDLIIILYRLGLVGVVKYKRGDYYQKFLNKNIYFANEKLNLPSSKYYLFHPTLDNILLSNYPNEQFYYPHCIIGNGLPFEFLRDKNFYMPKKISDTRLKKFELFYELPNSYEKYSAIENSIFKIWVPKIWSYFYKKDSVGWIQELSKEVNGNEAFHNNRRINNDNNIKSLNRNYKLRIVINISAFLGLIPDHDNLCSEVFYSLNFRDATSFINIRKSKVTNKQLEYMTFLSDFENKIVERVIHDVTLSEGLKKQLESDISLKSEFDSRIEKLKNRLQSYKD